MKSLKSARLGQFKLWDGSGLTVYYIRTGEDSEEKEAADS